MSGRSKGAKRSFCLLVPFTQGPRFRRADFLVTIKGVYSNFLVTIIGVYSNFLVTIIGVYSK